MEDFSFTETTFNDTSHENNSIDFSFWESLSISYVPDRWRCFWDYHFDFQNMTLQLNPWSELRSMSSMCKYIVVIRRITFWLPLVIGIPGNILALLTILQFPRTPGTFYLALLSIFDFMALVAKAMNVGILSFKLFNSISCKLILTLTNFTATYANWILVLICFERLVTVMFPLKKNYYFTMRRARLGAIVIAIIIFLFTSVYLWNITAGAGCQVIDADFDAKWSHVSTTLYSYLPAFLLIIMVLMIWRELKKIQKNRQYIFCGEEGASVIALTQQRLQEQAKTERSITIMLLFAAITFVLLTAPLCVVLAIENSNVLEGLKFSRGHLGLSRTIAVALVALSHAVNFFIYFVSTERFRANLRKLFHCSPIDRRSSANDRSLYTVEDQM